MLSFRHDHSEATLIERYWSALRRNRATPVPEGLDPDLATFIAEVEADLAPPKLSTTAIEQIWRRVEARAPEANRDGWSGPAIDPSTRRRTAAPPITEREEQPIMSDHVQPADSEPIPIQQRRWLRESLKLVAAAIIFVAIGAILALALRDDDDQTPAVGPSGPTPIPTVEATATPAAVVPESTEPSTPATAQPSPATDLPSFGTIAATIQVGQEPRNMAAGDGALWVTNAPDGTVSRIDLETNEVVATIQVVPAGDQAVDAIAVGAGSVWVTTQGSLQLARIDPATNQVVTTFSLGTAVHELVYGGGALWGRGTFSNTIVRIDPATNTVVATIDVAPPPFSIVYLNDALWSLGESDVSKIDPATNTVVASVPVDAPGHEIVAAGGSLWVAENTGPGLIQIDPTTTTIVARHSLPDDLVDVVIAGDADAVYICPCFDATQSVVWQFDVASAALTAQLDIPDAHWIAYKADTLWGVNADSGEITRVDVASSTTETAQPSPTTSLPSFGAIVATIPVGAAPRHMAASDDALWVTNADDGTVSRIDLSTNEVVATINVVPPGQGVTGVAGATQVDAIAVGDGAVWVTALNSAQLVRIDATSNEILARVSLSSGIHELEFGGGALWGKAATMNQIVRIDPATNTVVATIPIPSPTSLVYLNDALWVLDKTNVSKIDPATNTVVATIPYAEPSGTTVLSGVGMMRAAGGSLWVVAAASGAALVQIDPVSATIVNRVALPEGVEEVLIAGSSDALYACPCFEALDNTVWQLDLETLEFTASLVVPHASWIEFEAGDLWSYDRPQGEVTRVEISQ